jgi:hypothetical protein
LYSIIPVLPAAKRVQRPTALLSSAVLDLVEVYDGEGAVIFSKFVRPVLNYNSPTHSSPMPDVRQTYLLRQIQRRGESICCFTDL